MNTVRQNITQFYVIFANSSSNVSYRNNYWQTLKSFLNGIFKMPREIQHTYMCS